MTGLSTFSFGSRRGAKFAVAMLLVRVTCGEVISDLADVVVSSQADERVALEAKAEQFWRRVLAAAEEMRMTEHLELCSRTEHVIAELPAENEFVRTTLGEVLRRLRRADDAVLEQALASSGIASQRLAAPVGGGFAFSFFSGGGEGFLGQALRRFVAGGIFPERLAEHVQRRQADILPVLRGAADSAGNVLTDTRLASKLSFDVLKYDIYNKGVPKTPQAAKELAYKLVDAAGETRHRFTSFVTQAVASITQDTLGKHDTAASTATSIKLRAAMAGADDRTIEQVINL